MTPPGGASDDLEYLFVVTYGRSGSTLLMGLLNSIPGYVIRGENQNALVHLFHFHQQMMESKRKRGGSGEPTHPFYGVNGYPGKRALNKLRRLIVETVFRPGSDARVTGFKEIRWYHDDMEQYVAWLREVFPGARFVLNTRAHESVLASGWWAQGDREANARHLEVTEARMRALAAELGEAAYTVHYDDYVADPLELRGLYDWLGEPWDESAVRATMARRLTH